MRWSFQRVSAVLLLMWLAFVLYLIVLDLLKPKMPDTRHARSSKSSGMESTDEIKESDNITGQKPPGLNQDYVHVCFTSDENTVIGTLAAVNSIWKNSRSPVMFHLITDDKANVILRDWIENSELQDINYELKVFDTSLLKGKILVRGGRQELAKPMNYARFFYPDLLPDVHGRLVHIDDDVIVQGDITELANTPLEDGHIASFSEECTAISKRFSLNQVDEGNTYANFVNCDHPEIKKRNIKPTACSFSAGIYVTDLDRWREAKITEELMFWLDLNTRENVYGNQKGGGGSQPPLMISMYGRYSQMDPMWHVRHLGWTAGTRYSRHFIEQAKLLHWNGQFKPWGAIAQYQDIWDKYFVDDPSGKVKPVRKAKSA